MWYYVVIIIRNILVYGDTRIYEINIALMDMKREREREREREEKRVEK